VPTNRAAATGFTSTVSFTLRADEGANRLSWASMLICTNDGFRGVSGLRLPKARRTVTVDTVA
jgi:hypothetical protein